MRTAREMSIQIELSMSFDKSSLGIEDDVADDIVNSWGCLLRVIQDPPTVRELANRERMPNERRTTSSLDPAGRA